MTWTVDSSGTKTATIQSTLTFTNGSANIGVTNTCAAGDMVALSTTSALPTNFSAGVPGNLLMGMFYYVLASGLSSSNIQLSATAGGSAISAGSAGSGTQTGTFEHVLEQGTTNATYDFIADLSALNLGELAELALYSAVLSGGTLRRFCKCTVMGGLIPDAIKKGLPAPSDIEVMATLKQYNGTGRAFPWKVLRI